MATVAQLNVEIGARIASLQKGLKAAERELRQSGAKFSRLGDEITAGLSIPLGLAGVGAIKAAGDIESLTLALKSQLGTSAAAAEELNKLTEAAKNPGLGVEQAVRGSVRLQGVGLAAEEARQVLVQMGNAIAATGGSAQELDNVTRQFSQMISKGRVLQEDVSILSENMPGLAQLMQKAFGTQSVEAIREMGVSGKEFVLQITKAAEALPRVEGGIKNNIGNALDSLKQSAAKVGLAINTAFDITGGLESFSGYLLGIANAFSTLDPAVQKTILSIAALAIAVGPAFKAFGALKLIGSQVVSVFEGIVAGGKFVAGAVANAAKAFGALNTAMKVSVVGAALAAITALYFAYDEYTNSLTHAEQAEMAVNDVRKSAIASTEVERAKIGNLVAVLEDNTASLGSKKSALEQLKAISPAYFKDLDLEKGKVEGLTFAVDSYVRSLERSAIVKQATDEIAALSTTLKNIQEQGGPTILQQTGNAFKALGQSVLGGIATLGQTDDIFNRLNENTRTFNQIDIQQATQQKIEALRGLIKENIDLDVATVKTTESTKKYVATSAEAKQAGKVLVDVMKDITNATEKAKLIGEDEDIAKLEAVTKGIERLIDAGLKPASKEVQTLKAEFDKLTEGPKPILIDTIQNPGQSASGIGSLAGGGAIPQALPNAPIQDIPAKLTEAQQAAQAYAESLAYAKDIQQQLNDKTFNFSTGLSEVVAKMTEQGNVMGAVFAGMGDAISQAAAQGETSFAKLGLAAAGAAAKIVRAYIQQGVAAAVAKALGSLPFPLNLAAGAAAGGIAAALFTSLIGKIGVKGFASGTRDAPGGLALVGERGPELVNLPRHSQVFNAGVTSTALRGGQNLNITGEFVARGTEMVLVIDRTRAKENRFR
jgi:tape measure domain-containing protein